MNFCNIPNETLMRYVELCNLYAEYNKSMFELYVKWYQFYLPKQ
jgi:hypothetical protein